MGLAINKDLQGSIPLYRDSFATQGWVSIPNFLDSDGAQSVLARIAAETSWSISTLVQGKPFVATVDEFMAQSNETRGQFVNGIVADAQQRPFQYFYEYVRLIGADVDPAPGFDDLRGLLGSNELLALLSDITGAHSATRLDAQLTRYLPAQFLMQHNDTGDQHMGHRLVAYVLGFTIGWNPDWGGLLHLMDDTEEIADTLIPRFNTLNLFSVPRRHFVSQVSSFCPRERLSVTGWLLSH